MTLSREEKQSLKDVYNFLRDLLWQKIPPKEELRKQISGCLRHYPTESK